MRVQMRRIKARARQQKDPIALWRPAIKHIESRMGTSVASFFVFMRWVFLLNCALAILWLAVIVFPQVAAPSNEQRQQNESFSVVDIITGQGWLNTSEMFYAGYQGSLFNHNYDMAVAYTTMIGMMYIISFVSIVVTMGFNFSKIRDSTTLVARDSEYPFSGQSWAWHAGRRQD
jgi:hypothetical protein